MAIQLLLPHAKVARESFFLSDADEGKPIALKIDMAGHQLVKPDCSRFRATKTVSHSQYGETQ